VPDHVLATREIWLLLPRHVLAIRGCYTLIATTVLAINPRRGLDATTVVAIDSPVNEGAKEVREVPGVSDVVWKCPVCQQQWQEGDPDGSWLGCDYCHRCWHTACMPVKMRKEAQDSIANDKENEKWHCWVCASALNFLCGASEVYCCKKDINVKVFCMRCKRKELLSKVLSHEWLVCARDECQLRVHRRCVSGSNASWVCGIC